MKRPAVWLFALLALAGVFFSTAAGRRRGLLGGSGAVGLRAPAFTLPSLASGPVSLRSLRGRPVLLNFWATWCPNCKVELPVLARFARLEGNRVHIVGIDEREPASLVAPFVASHGYPWTFLLDRSGNVGDAYGVTALPTSFFLNAAGSVRQRYTGPMSLGQMKAFLREAGG